MSQKNDDNSILKNISALPQELTQELTQDIKQTKDKFFNSPWFPLWAFVIYGLFYMVAYFLFKPVAWEIANQNTFRLFNIYSLYAGWVFAFLSLIIIYILHGLKKWLKLGRLAWINPIIFFVATSPWLLLSQYLVYFQDLFGDLTKLSIAYVGRPLLFVSYLVFIFTFFWLLWELLRGDKKVR